MEVFNLVLGLAELIAIIVLIIVAVKQRQALSRHIKKVKKTFQSLKEDLEEKISKVSGKEEIDAFKKEITETLESHRRMMGEKIEANQIKYENAVQRISEKLGDSLERLSKTRSRITGEIKRFVRILAAALRGEEELLRTLAEPEKKDEVPAAEEVPSEQAGPEDRGTEEPSSL